MNLYIPETIQTNERTYLSLEAIYSLDKKRFFRETFLNILAFIPLGLLFHAVLRIIQRSSLKTSVFVLIVKILFAFGIESNQVFLAL